VLTKLDQFEILEVIGRGGMGTVYRGIDPLIGRAVAIKVIRLVGYKDKDEQSWLKERLFREARAVGRLNHPGIVTIYQVAEEQDIGYIAMEFVDGPNLQEILAREEKDRPALCRIIAETAAALDYAHQRGLVHRDIKPANLMVTAAGVTKVTDFGIAKTMLGQTATKNGMLIGTPYYMSPEQIMGQPLDGRSDQFALAVIAYEMFTGRKPFHAEQITSVCYQILHEEPLSPEDVNPCIGAEVATVIKRGLAKHAVDRYPTCTQFAEDLLAAVCAASGRSASRVSNTHASSGLSGHPTSPLSNPLPPPPQPGSISRNVKVFAIPTIIAVVAGTLVLRNAVKPAPARDVLPAPAANVSPPLTRAPELINAPAPHREAPAALAISEPPVQRVVPVSKSVSSPNSRPARLPVAAPESEVVAKQELVPDRPASPLSGLIIWTGSLRPGEFLAIDSEHLTAGRVVGVLPGRPVRIHVYPADLSDGIATAYTVDPGYVSPRRITAGKRDVTLTFDPRHATDLVVFESPAAQNNWSRLSIRANTNLSACVIEWRAE